MNIFRTFARLAASNGFRLSILLLAAVSAFVVAFGSPATVKQTVSDSGVYTTLNKAVAKQVTSGQNDQGGQSGASTPAAQSALQQPAVQDAAKTAFSPMFLQSSTEQIIDGTYHWLNGTSPQPDFKVDLTPAIKAFEDKAADSATSQLKKLPACTFAQLKQINPAHVDPFTLNCLPPGFNVDAQRQTIINSLADKNQYLKDPILTADRLPKDSNGQTVFQRASIAPKVFHWLIIGPWVLVTLAVLFALAVLFLTMTRRKGLGSIAMSLLINGLFLLAISFLAEYLLNHFFDSSSSPLHVTDNSSQQSVVKIIEAFDRIIGRTLLVFGVAYAGVAVVTMIVLRLTRPKAPVADPIEERRTIVRDKHNE